jgi:mannose-6-phosphate isomerase-like protein (cupin superfamily)
MQEKIREIATRIRELREISEIGIGDMARHLQLTPQLYREYENGSQDIPASLLYEIAQFLQVDMAVLLTGENPRLNIFTVTRKGKGVGVERRQQYKYQNLAANFIHKKAEPFLVTVEPKPAHIPITQNSHPGQEFNYIISGTLKLHIHQHEITLEEGDSIFFDSTCPHAMTAVGNQPAKFLAVIL